MPKASPGEVGNFETKIPTVTGIVILKSITPIKAITLSEKDNNLWEKENSKLILK